jgi:tRNA threonylcarbamoyladenosine biosynthesis protein TsaB
MTLLAIDTSTAYASVALFDGRAVLAEETWHAHRRHDDHLFPAIERLLAHAGAALGDLSRIGVAVGPGSFTGIRVAIAAAQGIARGSGALAVGVATLDVAAQPFAASRRRVCALLPVGRGEHYAAMYRQHAGEWSRRSAIATVTIAELARTIAMDTVFAGEIDDATAAELRERLGARATIPPASATVRRAGHLAEIAWRRAESGGAVAAGALEPLYIRAPLIRGPAGEVRPAVPGAAVASAPPRPA